MKPYGRTRRQSSHAPHGAQCRVCYPDIGKREGRRKAREAGKQEAMEWEETLVVDHQEKEE